MGVNQIIGLIIRDHANLFAQRHIVLREPSNRRRFSGAEKPADNGKRNRIHANTATGDTLFGSNAGLAGNTAGHSAPDRDVSKLLRWRG